MANPEIPAATAADSAALHAASERAQAACARATAELVRGGIATEALAAYVPERRRLKIFRVAATMRPQGSVWRLGTLLLHTDGTLSQLGTATRSRERGRVGYQSNSREARHDIAAAALKGGYPVGTAVNFGALPLDLSPTGLTQLTDEAPIGYFDGEVRVRWRRGAALSGASTLQAYLEERVALALHPPFSDADSVS